MQHSPRKSARLIGGEATPITTVSQQPASSGAGTRTRVNITAASIPCPATTVTTVASQPRSTAVTAASSVPEVNQPLALELMERIAALERELEKAKPLESVSTANCAPIAVGPSAVGANSGASGRPPFWSGQPIPTSNGEALHNGVGSVPYNGDGASGAACTLPPSSSGPPLLTTSNYFVEPLCATGTAQPAHGLVLPGVSIHNAATALPLVGSYAATTPSGIQGMQHMLQESVAHSSDKETQEASFVETAASGQKAQGAPSIRGRSQRHEASETPFWTRRGAAILELGKMQHSPRKSARLIGGEATPITTVSQQPASSGAGTRTRVNITAASIPCPATTVTTVASQPRSTAVTAASSVPEVNQPLALELMERIAALERELEKARPLESVSTANCAPIAVGPSAVGANSGASGRPPFWSGQPIPTSNGEALHNGVGSVPYNGDGASGAACTLPPSSSGPPLLTTSNYFVEPLCATGTAQPTHGLVLPGVSIHNAATALPLVGS
ncbi:uncharacterized protein LOC122624414 [Drosophila teissieri]|uniref:uncharacterized protein LOC122624414 n=1 Tax=Drosophila teissieri TaxID=7243 RepID=UPI001CBA1AEA|nr:uncharacterized protein LOC122624414 [Drosophila teissieri]